MILVDVCGDISCAHVINDNPESWLIETRIQSTPIEIQKNSAQQRVCRDMFEAMSWIQQQQQQQLQQIN